MAKRELGNGWSIFTAKPVPNSGNRLDGKVWDVMVETPAVAPTLWAEIESVYGTRWCSQRRDEVPAVDHYVVTFRDPQKGQARFYASDHTSPRAAFNAAVNYAFDNFDKEAP